MQEKLQAIVRSMSIGTDIVRFRRAHEAHRDARLVFRAAAEGRPLELQKRLVLGKLAGGLRATGIVATSSLARIWRDRIH